MPGTLLLDHISTKRQRIAQLAKEDPNRAFLSLAHHMDIYWMREAYRQTRKSGAPGVDGLTADDYAANLGSNLQSLLDRAKSGAYRAPPVRRVHIPKGDGSTRPLGIPTFEDKVLQRAVVMLLEAVYEQDFLDCSYGFRPGRSAHQGLEALWNQAMDLNGGWILEVDIRKFFDTIDKNKLREILNRRVRDGVVMRLIGKWMNAGVLEDGCLTHPEAGTPQGGVISPLLANIYLHEVLDVWFETEVKPRLQGRAFLVRYADDFVIGFSEEADARRVWDVLPKRFGKYALALHPDKTRLIPFQRPRTGSGSGSGGGPGTFDLLGFTHFWGVSRKGWRVIQRKTATDRFTRTLQRVRDWCRQHLHDPIAAQHKALSRALRGHYSYFGLTSNYRSLSNLRDEVQRIWHRWLCRRSQKGDIQWAVFARLLKRFPLPPVRIVHSFARP